MSALAGAAVLVGAQAIAPVAAEAATSNSSTDPVAHLLRRTTYGMNVDQIYGVNKMGADKWLAAQMDPYKKVPDKAMDHLATRWPRVKWEIWQVRDRLNNGGWDVMEDLVDLHIARAIWSRRQLLEVMVDFWSNHFNITCPSSNVWDSRARFDRDVIRINAFGRFEDMLDRLGQAPGDAQLPQQRDQHVQAAERELRPRGARAAHGRHQRRLHRGRHAQLGDHLHRA